MKSSEIHVAGPVHGVGMVKSKINIFNWYYQLKNIELEMLWSLYETLQYIKWANWNHPTVRYYINFVHYTSSIVASDLIS